LNFAQILKRFRIQQITERGLRKINER